MAQFPAVKELFREAFEAFASARGVDVDEVQQRVKDSLGVSSAALQSWRSGQRRPNDETFGRLLEFLVADPEQRARLCDQWPEAREQRVSAWAERVQDGQLELKVKHAAYAGAGRFWQDLLQRLLQLARIGFAPVPMTELDFREVQDMLWQPGGRLDVASGLLATPTMAVKLHFFCCPAKYRVNMVLVDEHWLDGPSRAQLQAAFAPHPLLDPPRKKGVYAFDFPHCVVVMEGEVGETYATLLPDPPRTWQRLPHLSAAAFADWLADTRRAIAAADEITCLEIVSELRQRGKAASLLFPLRQGQPNEIHDRGALLPEFPLSLAVSKNLRGNQDTQELIRFLDDALSLFLEGNTGWVAASYLGLRRDLEAVARRALPGESARSIRSWANYACRLTDEAVRNDEQVPFPWRRALRQAVDLDRGIA